MTCQCSITAVGKAGGDQCRCIYIQAPEVTWPQPCRLLPFHPTARSSYFTFSSRTNHRILFFDRFVWIRTAQHSTAQEEMKMRTPAIAFAALLMLLLLATRAHGMVASCMAISSISAPCEVYPSWTDMTMHIPLYFSKQESGWTGSCMKQSTARSVQYTYTIHELL